MEDLFKRLLPYAKDPRLLASRLVQSRLESAVDSEFTDPASATHRLVQKLYLDPRSFVLFRDDFQVSLNRLNTLRSSGEGTDATRGVALVFLLRGHYVLHNIHQYIVALSLEALGFSVRLVACHGSVERCGTDQAQRPERAPPTLCGACCRLTELARGPFPILSLNDHAPKDEEREVSALIERSGKALFVQLRPSLMRYFQGDIRAIKLDHPQVRMEMRAAARFLLRFRSLARQADPAVVCLFNGLFLPERILVDEARGAGIATLTVERGMRRNTMFATTEGSACHYASEKLWRLSGKRTAAEREVARRYLEERVSKGPEDPTGVRRKFQSLTETEARRLSGTALLFAPVTHDTASMVSSPFGDFAEALVWIARECVRSRKTLFIRAHPDEHGQHNPSRLPVRNLLQQEGLLESGHVVLFDSTTSWNSYELARAARSVIVFNGTLGMELPAMGIPVWNLANSHYSGKGFTYDVRAEQDIVRVLQDEHTVAALPGMKEAALDYLYYYVFIANLDVGALWDEYSPFLARTPDADPAVRREQFARFQERIDVLVS